MPEIKLPTFEKRQAWAHLVVGLFVALAALSGLQVWLRDAIVDARFKVATRPASGTVALIEIDPKSIEAIGHWPWRRTLHSDLLKQLGKSSVADIAFDVDFSSSSLPAEDAAFVEALRQAGSSVILPAFRQRFEAQADGSPLHVNRPLPQFLADSWLALVDIRPDRDGIARHYSYGDRVDGTFIPSMGAILAGRHQENGETFRIDFGILPSSIPRYSYIDVLRGVPTVLQALSNRKVVIAGTAAELGDRLNAPNGTILPGSIVLALAAETIIQERALATTSGFVSIAMVVGVILLMAFAWSRAHLGVRVAGLAAVALLGEISAIVLQASSSIVVDTSLLLSACFAYLVVAMFDEIGLRGILRLVAERRFQRITMSLRDGLVCADDMGRITFWNPAASDIFGYEAGQAIGRPFWFLLDMDDTAATERFELTAIPSEQLRHANGYVVELGGRRVTGDRFDLECSLSAWDTPGGVQYGAVLRDISQRKRQQARIRFLAECDVLTGLPNRNSLLAELERQQARPTALLLVGIDRFGQINHLHGASFADALLVAVASRLTALATSIDFVARLSDGEFAVLAPTDRAEAFGRRIIVDFQNTAVGLGARSHRVAMAVGCAEGLTAEHPEEWLGNAQFALASARSALISEPVGFTPSMRLAIVVREALELELRKALARNEFELFYQPQVDLRSGKVVGAEALIRWRHPQRGYVSPGEFMPVVNATSLAEGVSAWVMETAFLQAAIWYRAGHPVRIGINLSQCQFSAGDLVTEVKALLAVSQVPPELIELEVTEDIVLENFQKTNAIFIDLRAQSIKMAFDDFGTGYGSLTYLKKFSLDTIKIDQTFVKSLTPGSDDAAIVSATIELGHSLGLSVIAEGIEDDATARFLHDLGCDEGQGYHFGRPVSSTEFEKRFFASPGSVAA
ncbi:EAL domain-containing protein [Methylobacterium sp. WL9]|uniref:EAL domain-containing protein n=1 Tax=Methylobacterium sp. WL9 TaxID=2603898 RepID=UPI0011CC8661|nr:EAL domain-containing protein [Methylobacterium sp. WL9]TXN20991.1 EAL domain-containing protein [Methylobacterium sp. WL9]